ncbi:TerD family protein [Sanguibacter sp. 25GB23B1]|uniref:TerD family protein n=1 Tax=Sanguibacter sp. 25GB23B1 TaxID=3156067 RepID=UPI0032AFE10A
MKNDGPLPSAVAERYRHGYAVVDVETSGLSPARDRVLQVSVMQLSPGGDLEGAWSQTLDPGCDPGPVHIHGLTRERLAGSPRYEDIAAQVSDLVRGRVFVAHNASFDWRFLEAESHRAHQPLTATGRLCTMSLSRRLDIGSAGLSLASVAAYWGVQQNRAHDAVDDTRVTTEILRHSLVAAARLDLTLPVVTASSPSRGRRNRPPEATRRQACPWVNPGRRAEGAPLVQGMTVVFTGPTRQSRDDLARSATTRGLDVMGSVSGRTSVLVTNDRRSGSTKADAARANGTSILSEDEFTALLGRVSPGTPRSTTPPTRPRAAAPRTAVPAPTDDPLHGRRVLILGGPHERAVDLRARIIDLGGQVAVNLSASVTDVVELADARLDRRWSRVTALGLGQLDPHDLARSTSVPGSAPPTAGTASASIPTSSVTLARGAVVDLPDHDRWQLSVRWDERLGDRCAVDVVAFVVDETEQVGDDSDFCFFNSPAHPSGALDLVLETRDEALVEIRPGLLPHGQHRVIVAASIDGAGTFGDLGPIELVLRDPDGAPLVRSVIDAASIESTLVLAAIYDRGGTWRIRAVGQGFETDLAALAARHGVDVSQD